jgi:SOS-response transcriptional repressor LexA
VRVVGPSMTPTLRDGDVVLVRRTTAVRAGDVVLATFADLPDRFVVKRAVRRHEDGWWVSSDNQFAGGDSAAHGVAAVHARAVLRIPAGSGPLRRPRRIAGAAIDPP